MPRHTWRVTELGHLFLIRKGEIKNCVALYSKSFSGVRVVSACSVALLRKSRLKLHY